MITQSVCTSFKAEIIQGIHQPSHDYKIALFLDTATLNASTSSYLDTEDEVSNGDGYTTGGVLLSGYDVGVDGTAAYLTFDNPSWNDATITARGALVYNDSLSGKNGVCVIDFGSNKSSSSGTFTIILSSSLIRYV